LAATDDVLRAIQAELTWIAEGPESEGGGYTYTLKKTPNWKKLYAPNSVREDVTSFCVDGEIYVDKDLRLFREGVLEEKNPRVVSIRVVDPGTKVRAAVIMIREDVYPTDNDLAAVGYY
jgi:hypothetical protein